MWPRGGVDVALRTGSNGASFRVKLSKVPVPRVQRACSIAVSERCGVVSYVSICAMQCMYKHSTVYREPIQRNSGCSLAPEASGKITRCRTSLVFSRWEEREFLASIANPSLYTSAMRLILLFLRERRTDGHSRDLGWFSGTPWFLFPCLFLRDTYTLYGIRGIMFEEYAMAYNLPQCSV